MVAVGLSKTGMDFSEVVGEVGGVDVAGVKGTVGADFTEVTALGAWVAREDFQALFRCVGVPIAATVPATGNEKILLEFDHRAEEKGPSGGRQSFPSFNFSVERFSARRVGE